MKVWIDADAAPQEVKETVYRASARLQLETILVANQPLTTPAGYPLVRSIQVSAGADVADRLIVARAEPGDVVITADIPLAAMLVDRGIQVISPRGEEYSEANIRSRLAMRDFLDHLRGSGVETGGAAPYGPKDKRAFAAALDRILTRAVRQK